MISLIIGNKGSGKTKKLIDMVNAAVESSKGNVFCIEKGRKLTYDISHKARLIDTDVYGVSGYDQFYGFLSGLCAANYDVTDICIDATLKIGGRDYEALTDFIASVAKLSELSDTHFIFTVSADESELPARIFDMVAKV